MITVEGLRYRYPKNRADTLKGLSFSVAKGEIFGFLGPSGAGKSTLQKILTGALPGFAGKAEVLGRPAGSAGDAFYERIGVDFEFPNFYGKFTARQNLRYFASLYAKPPLAMDPLLERMGLLPHADQRVDRFSKGMKTRLAFLRCLLHGPDLLFLDEPTSGLDPANARILKDMVQELRAAGKTVILTTHNMHDAEELCDRVAFIVEGEIRALDAPAALRGSQRETQVTYTTTPAAGEGGAPRQHSLLLRQLGEDTAFLAAAAAGRLTRIHSQEPTLEDVFISLTGRHLQ